MGRRLRCGTKQFANLIDAIAVPPVFCRLTHFLGYLAFLDVACTEDWNIIGFEIDKKTPMNNGIAGSLNGYTYGAHDIHQNP